MKTLQLLALFGSLGLAPLTWSHPGDVYAMSNDASGNQISVLSHGAGGKLVVTGTYATGGRGSGLGTADQFDALGSQSSLLLSHDKRWLFAVNAGSDEISVLRVERDGLKLTDVVKSGGSYPDSLTLHDGKLYVLNAAEGGNVTAFQLDGFGHLRAIPGSTRLLHAVTPDVGSQPNSFYSPTQLLFTPDGQWLVIAVKNLGALGTIQLFHVGYDGSLASKPVVTTDLDPLPFGFMFDRSGHLLVTEGLTGAVTSYSIERNGKVQPIASLVANGQIATCWIDGSGPYLYTSNTNSNTLSGYLLERDGSLRLLESDGIAADLGANHDPSDVRVSGDGKFLYVVNTGAGTVGAFRIERNGQLTSLGETPVFAPLSGMQGLAAE